MNTHPRSALLAFPLLAALAACSSSGSHEAVAEDPAAVVPGTLDYDRSVFHSLLEQHDHIRRDVTLLDNGVSTLTESDDPAVAARIIDHVEAMRARLHDDRRLRQWDPLFVAMFDHAPHITMTVERTPRGVRVSETSTDPRTAALIKLHSKAVSGFVSRGFQESALAHTVPPELEPPASK